MFDPLYIRFSQYNYYYFREKLIFLIDSIYNYNLNLDELVRLTFLEISNICNEENNLIKNEIQSICNI